jgi:hypothetical protein
VIKRDQGKRMNRKRDHYSIDVDVTPTYAGEVTAHMEYAEKRGLVLTMQFAKGAARAWFEQHRTEFTEAIQALGFRGVDVRFARAPRGRETPNSSTSGRQSGQRDATAEIDIKI